MASYKNIEEYRRKKKRRRILRNTAIVVILACLLVIVLFGVKYFRESSLQDKITGGLSAEEQQFPLAISKEQPMDILAAGDGFAVLSKSSVLTYASSGKRQQTISHGYTNPVMKVNNKRILTYDRGGNKLRVDTLNSKIGEITTDSTILCAAIAPNGNIAIAMSYISNAPVIVVYDSNLNVIYRYLTTEEFSTISFSEDGSNLVLSNIVARNGLLSAEVYEMNITKEEEARVTEVADFLPLQAIYSGNRILLIGMDGVVSLDGNRQQTRWESKGALEHFALASSGVAVMVNNDVFSNNSIITSLSSDGKVITEAEPEEEIIDVSTDGKRILVLGEKTLFIYDMSMKLLQKINLERNFIEVTQNNNMAYIMSENSIERKTID